METPPTSQARATSDTKRMTSCRTPTALNYCCIPPQNGSTSGNSGPTGWTVVCLANHPKRNGIGRSQETLLRKGILVHRRHQEKPWVRLRLQEGTDRTPRRGRGHLQTTPPLFLDPQRECLPRKSAMATCYGHECLDTAAHGPCLPQSRVQQDMRPGSIRICRRAGQTASLVLWSATRTTVPAAAGVTGIRCACPPGRARRRLASSVPRL